MSLLPHIHDFLYSGESMKETMTLLLEKDEMGRILDRMAAQVLERHPGCEGLMLVGIQRRGVDLARRLKTRLEANSGVSVPLGTLDINLYRDDWTTLEGKPQIGISHIPESPDGRVVLLVDDVLFSGRTVRAALEAILDYGRPRSVELAVLVDRGNRELPIHADYAGRKITTERNWHVDVMLEERDGEDMVRLNIRGIAHEG